jgi:hypothetical protein
MWNEWPRPLELRICAIDVGIAAGAGQGTWTAPVVPARNRIAT